MGWKSTEYISRKKAVELLAAFAASATNEKLAEALEAIGFGDDPNLPCYGFNFIVSDEPSEYEERRTTG